MPTKFADKIKKAATPETLESLHRRVKETAAKALVVKLHGSAAPVKKLATETMEELTLLLTQKARSDLGKKSMSALDWEIGGYMDDQLEKMEGHLPTDEAVRALGKTIRASIDSVQEITGIRTSVPHAGRLAEIFDASRLARQTQWSGEPVRSA